MIRGVDCASSVSARAAEILKAEGFEFVCRYLVPPSYTKALSWAEAEILHAAGLDILLVWETTAARMRGGAAAGREDGTRAYARARELGVPYNAILYFAADFNAQPEEMSAIRNYMISASIEIQPYRVGIYGGYRTIEAVKTMPIHGFWQCVAWSGGKVSDAMTVYQSQWQGTDEAKTLGAKLGFAVDIDECPDTALAGMWSHRQPEPEPVDDWSGHHAADAIRWGMETGLIVGYPDGSIRPDEPVPLWRLLTILERFSKMEGQK